jgi:hypothetical protein
MIPVFVSCGAPLPSSAMGGNVSSDPFAYKSSTSDENGKAGKYYSSLEHVQNVLRREWHQVLTELKSLIVVSALTQLIAKPSEKKRGVGRLSPQPKQRNGTQGKSVHWAQRHRHMRKLKRIHRQLSRKLTVRPKKTYRANLKK